MRFVAEAHGLPIPDMFTVARFAAMIAGVIAFLRFFGDITPSWLALVLAFVIALGINLGMIRLNRILLRTDESQKPDNTS